MRAQTEDRTEIYRGHLKECLVDLGQNLAVHRPKYSRGVTAVRQPVADFCEVKTETVLNWVSPKGPVPQGRAGEGRVVVLSNSMGGTDSTVGPALFL